MKIEENSQHTMADDPVHQAVSPFQQLNAQGTLIQKNLKSLQAVEEPVQQQKEPEVLEFQPRAQSMLIDKDMFYKTE